LVADNTYSRVEGEFTILTHVTLARGEEGEHHDEDGEHHGDRRKLSHFWTDYKWENPNCDRVISVGDCHSNNGGQDFSTMLTDVVDKWNNVPQNQDLTGTTYTPTGITFQKTTCDGDNPITCDNFDILGRISSCNGDYGATGWAGLASIWTYTGVYMYMFVCVYMYIYIYVYVYIYIYIYILYILYMYLIKTLFLISINTFMHT
jgi:hypothetical protein